MAASGHSRQKTDAGGDGERQQRALADLVLDPADGVAAQPRGLVGHAVGAVAHAVGGVGHVSETNSVAPLAASLALRLASACSLPTRASMSCINCADFALDADDVLGDGMTVAVTLCILRAMMFLCSPRRWVREFQRLNA